MSISQERCQGNPVVIYLQRHSIPEGRLMTLTNEGYTMSKSIPTTFFTLLMNFEPYSIISSDFNLIHVNPYFSDYASLPGTITHGTWSSAATRKYVENVMPAHVIAYIFFIVSWCFSYIYITVLKVMWALLEWCCPEISSLWRFVTSGWAR